MPSDITAEISNPFTQSWIQALTQAADSPVARTIKPKLELIDKISLQRSDGERDVAAQELWDYAVECNLTSVLSILPAMRPAWEFPDDDRFQFERKNIEEITDFAMWQTHLGLQPARFSMKSSVTSSDWTTLVRDEAVRQQKPFNSTAFSNSNKVEPDCVAVWDTSKWTIRFDDIEWLSINYEEPPLVQRPAFGEIEETLTWALAQADSELVPKRVSQCTLPVFSKAWYTGIDSLAEWHGQVLGNRSDYSPWLRRTWQCVWPTVYREQNVLRGQADVTAIRSEMAACIRAVPQLTVWMFVFAKLTCFTQTGMGLGISVDYTSG